MRSGAKARAGNIGGTSKNKIDFESLSKKKKNHTFPSALLSHSSKPHEGAPPDYCCRTSPRVSVERVCLFVYVSISRFIYLFI